MVQALKQYTASIARFGPGGIAMDGPSTSANDLPDADVAVFDSQETNTVPELSTQMGFASVRRPLSSTEEILQVPGFSRSLWFGEDANLNGHLDPNEDDGDEQYPPDNHDGRLDHGMRQYFTANSWDPEWNSAGKPRMDINHPITQLLPPALPPGFTNFIAAMHGAKIKLSHPSALLGGVIHVKDTAGGDVEMASGILPEHLPVVLDLFTTDSEDRHDGRVNLNTASSVVLATLPGVDFQLAETIVSTRTGLSAERRTTSAWLVQEGLMDVERFKALAPCLTTRSCQFHFFVLGYGIPSGRYCVIEAAIDIAGREPQITYLRDLTRLGLPFRPTGDGTHAPGGMNGNSGNAVNKRPPFPFFNSPQHG